MKFNERMAVSIIVATLLLIAISVIAAVLVYVFVGGLAGNLTQNGGQPVTEKLTIQAYTFSINPSGCVCTQELLEIFLLNPGPALTKVSAVYYDGTLLTLQSPVPGISPGSGLVNDGYYLVGSSSTMASGAAGDIYFSVTTPKTSYAVGDVGQLVIMLTPAVAYGTGHTVKVVSSTGATNVFTVVAGIAG